MMSSTPKTPESMNISTTPQSNFKPSPLYPEAPSKDILDQQISSYENEEELISEVADLYLYDHETSRFMLREADIHASITQIEDPKDFLCRVPLRYSIFFSPSESK